MYQPWLKTIAATLLFAAAAYGQAPAGDAAKGKDLYDKKYMCYTCHGHDGNGGNGVRLIPMKRTQASFTAYVRNPARMPAYSSKVLSDQELGDIWAYVKSLPESKPAASIPLIQQIASQN